MRQLVDFAAVEPVDDVEFAGARLEVCVRLMQTLVCLRRLEVAVVEGRGGAWRGMAEVERGQGGRVSGVVVRECDPVEDVLRGDVGRLVYGRRDGSRDGGIGVVRVAGRRFLGCSPVGGLLK